MIRLQQLATTLLVGICGALVSGAVVFTLFSRSIVVLGWLLVGLPLGTLLAYVAPTSVVYWIDAEGGPASFLGFVVVGSVLTWTVLFAVLFSVWRTRRRAPRPAI